MKFAAGFIVAALCMAFGADAALADSVTVDYPSADSIVVASVGTLGSGDLGFFWSATRGDRITETFAGTGLYSVGKLDLEFDITQNVLQPGAFTDWNVFVNGTAVGGFIWAQADGTGTANLSYNFAPIIGNGTYTISMEMANTVAGGDGSIAIGVPGAATFTGTSTVPEPASLAMLGVGLLGVWYRRRRKA